nr:wall-associated receptor kinase 2-like [Tanacetum cinerariifolium]
MTPTKIRVLIWAVFQMFSFTTSDTNSTTESHTLINSTNLAKPGCNSTCGDLVVPYPFGVGINSGCSIDSGFDIYCNTSVTPPTASFTETDYVRIKFISDSTLRTTNIVASKCYSLDGTTYNDYNISVDFSRYWPYTVSEVNKFTVIGCDDYAWLTSATKSRSVSTGCMVFCASEEEVAGDECTGNGCCQSSIPQDISSYTTKLNSLMHSGNVSNMRLFAPCTYAFVGEENKFKFNGATDLIDGTSFVERIEATVPRVLEWAIGNLNCSVAEATDGYVCQSNSTCVSSPREAGGYRCVCKDGYEGNPYLSPGCEDINECEDPRTYPCYGECVNTVGGYNCTCLQGTIGDAKKPNNCTCPKGSYGDAKILNGCQPFAAKDARWKLFVIATVIALLAILCGIVGICFGIRKRKVTRLREKFFEQNGGVLLKQKIDSQGSHKEMTLFSTTELRKATDNYSQEKIVGQGAYGVVYKGILSDKRVVAIKKSKVVDGSQAEQFINEVLILTQVIHRNVVKLLGCCLEEEVPVLVYEFISNNTLYHHIHHRFGGMSWLPSYSK